MRGLNQWTDTFLVDDSRQVLDRGGLAESRENCAHLWVILRGIEGDADGVVLSENGEHNVIKPLKLQFLAS